MSESQIDTRVLPEYLDQKFFVKSLQAELKNDKIKVVDYSLKYATSGGDNYTSDIYRATIKYKTSDNQKTPFETSYIAKSIPYVGVRQEILDDFKIFDKEVEMYNDILPILSNLLNGEFLNAQCFYNESNPIKTIVFQDLARLGFRLSDRKAGLDLDHCKLVMRKLARLHGSSMVLAQNNPELMATTFKYGIFSPDTYYDGAIIPKFFEEGAKMIPEIVETWGEEFKVIAEKMHKIAKNFKKSIFECLENDKIRIKVLNHGDMWVNNIMFKYNDSNHVKDIVFVDYQMSCFNSLGYDLNYFLATSPNNSIRISERNNLVSYYHKCLVETLESLQTTIEIPSLEDVQNEVYLMEFYGYTASIAVLPIVLAEKMQEETNFDMMVNDDTAAFFRKKNLSSPLYVQAVKEIFKRFNEIGVLDYYSR